MGKNVLITGNAGFIGTNLTKFLHNKGYNIRGMDNLSTGVKKYVPDYVEMMIHSDITNYTDCIEATKNVDVVLHMAAESGVKPSIENPVKANDVNVAGTLNLLQASVLNGVKKFIFASSGGTILGSQDPPVHEESPIKPISPYGASKAAAEHYCNAYYESFGLNTNIVRFSNVYGPYSLHKIKNLIPAFILSLIHDKPFTIFGNGHQTRDFIYVSDLINAIYSIMLLDEIENETFQIATGVETQINEIIDLMNLNYHKRTGRWKEVINGDRQVGDVEKNYAIIDKAKSILGWEPEVAIEDGIEKLFEIYL